MLKEKLKRMFTETVLVKNARLIPHYYHPDFVLYTNGQMVDFKNFLKSHEDYYASAKEYTVAYDEEAFVEEGSRLAARVWITITVPGEPPKELEVILIALYKENKIYRLWELTYPDWSQLPEFKNTP